MFTAVSVSASDLLKTILVCVDLPLILPDPALVEVCAHRGLY